MKVTLTMQVPKALMLPEVGQVVAVESLKSEAFVPLIAMLVMLSPRVVLVSVNVEVIAVLVEPTFTDPKFMEDGSRVTVGPLELVPVPVRVMT